MPADYHPEIDISDELSAVDAVYYQSQIGILWWIVELGRVDIALECSMMSYCLALPREDHLRKVFQIFVYLKTNNSNELVFDSCLPDWWSNKEGMFPRKDWKGKPYPHGEECLKEEIPENAPEPRGKGITMSVFVDSDHFGCKVNLLVENWLPCILTVCSYLLL